MYPYFVFILVAATFAAGQQCAAQIRDEGAAEKPKSLLAFVESRRSITSGVVSWNVAVSASGRTQHYVNRYAANGDLICEYRGDQDGWVSYRAPENVGQSRFPELLLSNDTGVWRYSDTTIQCSWWPRGEKLTGDPPAMMDYRLAGVFSTSGSIERAVGDRQVWESDSDPILSYDEGREGGLVYVRGMHDSGATTEWLLDPRKDYNALSIISRTARGDETKMDADVEKRGGVWLPTRITYSRRGTIEATVTLESASLNSQADPVSFSPADIGIEPGMAVSNQRVAAAPTVGQNDWNGDTVVPHAEFVADVKSGRRIPGPTVKQVWDQGYFDSPYLTEEQRDSIRLAEAKMERREGAITKAGLWQKYVERFIQKYDLDDEQAQKCRRLLADCDALAEKAARKTEARWNEVQAQLKQAIDAGDGKKAIELRDESKKLSAPIEKIFEDRLKPGLEKIPTRAQRQKAETEKPTSTPAKP